MAADDVQVLHRSIFPNHRLQHYRSLHSCLAGEWRVGWLHFGNQQPLRNTFTDLDLWGVGVCRGGRGAIEGRANCNVTRIDCRCLRFHCAAQLGVNRLTSGSQPELALGVGVSQLRVPHRSTSIPPTSAGPAGIPAATSLSKSFNAASPAIQRAFVELCS